MENFNNVPSTGTFGESIAVVNENFLLAQQKMEELQALYNALQQTEPEIIEPSDTWPVANPEEGVIYRVIDRVNTPPQYYSDFMWNGTSMVQMARYNNAIDDEPTPGSANLVKSGGVAANIVYDISAAHSGTTYADLASALGTNGANVPVAVRKGGMSVKFVCSSDNKYVQARCMAQNFTTDVTQWQGVDDEPTAGSKNLAESYSVWNNEAAIKEIVDTQRYKVPLYAITGRFADGVYVVGTEKTKCFLTFFDKELIGIKENLTFNLVSKINQLNIAFYSSESEAGYIETISPTDLRESSLRDVIFNNSARYFRIDGYKSSESLSSEVFTANIGIYYDTNLIVRFRNLEQYEGTIQELDKLKNKSVTSSSYSDKETINFKNNDTVVGISLKGKYYNNAKTGQNLVKLTENLYNGNLFVQGNIIRRFRSGAGTVNIPFDSPITLQQGVKYYVSIWDAEITACWLGTAQDSGAYNMYGGSVEIIGDGTTYTRFRIGISENDLVDGSLKFSISTTKMNAFEEYVGGVPCPTPANPSDIKDNFGTIVSHLLGYTGVYQNYCPQFIQGNISSETGDYETDSLFVCTKDFIPVVGVNCYIKRSVITSYFRIRCYDKDKTFLPNNTENFSIIGSTDVNERFVILTLSSSVKYIKITDRSNDLSTNYFVTPFPQIPLSDIQHSTALFSTKVGDYDIYGLPYSQDILNINGNGNVSIVHNNAIVKLNTLSWESMGDGVYKTSSLSTLRKRRNGNINATHYSVSDAGPGDLGNYSITALEDGNIYVKDNRFSDVVADFVASLSNDNMLLYEKAESTLENTSDTIAVNISFETDNSLTSFNSYYSRQALVYFGDIEVPETTVSDNYASIEELKEDITIASGMVCKTVGYAMPNDDGAATYVISDTPSSVSILLSNGLYANMVCDNGVVKAEQIGVLPRGKENGLNLQKFINNNVGGEIHFGNKVYEFNSEIVFPQDGYIKLIGHGYSNLVYNGTGIFISAYGRTVVIKNLRIANKNVRNSAIGIRLGYLDTNNPSNNKFIMNSRIEDVYMWGFDIDMEIDYAWKMNISNVFLQGANIGLKINDMLSSVFINCNLENNIYGGIIVMADGVSFYTPCIEGNSDLSLDIQGGIDITIYDAYFETLAAGIKTSDDANVTIYSMFTCYPSLYQFGKNTKVIRPKGYGGFLKSGSRKIKEAPTYNRAPLNLTSIDAKCITEWFKKETFDESFVYDEENNIWESSDGNYKLGGFANNPSESLPNFSFSDGTGVISLKVWVKNDLIPESGRVVFDFELEQTLVESDRCFVNIGSVSEQTYNYDSTGLGNHHDAIYNENRLQYWFDFIKNELTTEGGYSLFEIGLYHNDSSAFTAEIKGIALFDDVLEL